jgi:hypothetical protein
MINEFPENRWYLYDNTSGGVILKHPYRPGIKVLCPYCNKPLVIDNYRATCCNNQFKTYFGEIHQIIPVGKHDKTKGRGWQSLRPFKSRQDD